MTSIYVVFTIKYISGEIGMFQHQGTKITFLLDYQIVLLYNKICTCVFKGIQLLDVTCFLLQAPDFQEEQNFELWR